jgi:hypothetical protein
MRKENLNSFPELKEQITKNVTAHCRFRFMCEVIPFVQEELDTAGKDLQTKTAIYDESNRYFVQESKKLEEIIQILKKLFRNCRGVPAGCITNRT